MVAGAKLVVKEGYNRGAVLPLDRDPVRIGRDENCEVRLLDPEASRDHARIFGLAGAPTIEDHRSRNGVFVNGVRCERKPLFHGDEIRIGKSVFLFLQGSGAGDSVSRLPGPADETQTAPGAVSRRIGTPEARPPSPEKAQAKGVWFRGSPEILVGVSPGILRISSLIHKAAPTGMAVLITGESGTGKELVARAVHSNSDRRNGPFVAVNAAAIPETLLESELFGHEKGAFTGAVARRTGRFEEADGGTLFLDEIGETGATAQAKLLRALEEGVVRRVGSEAPFPVNVRLIAAMNRDPVEAVREGRLREDLYYRLKGFEIRIPPLRERPEDIPELARHFFRCFREKLTSRLEDLSDGVLECFREYHWPGNVRELRNAIERAMIVAEGEKVERGDLPPDIRRKGGRKGAEEPMPLLELERRHILKALRHTGGNKSRAAEILGIHRKTLYSKMKLHGIR